MSELCKVCGKNKVIPSYAGHCGPCFRSAIHYCTPVTLKVMLKHYLGKMCPALSQNCFPDMPKRVLPPEHSIIGGVQFLNSFDDEFAYFGLDEANLVKVSHEMLITTDWGYPAGHIPEVNDDYERRLSEFMKEHTAVTNV